MTRCEQLRPYLDGETNPLQRWHMRRHLRECHACSEQKAAEEALAGFLQPDPAADSPEDIAAIRRITDRWSATLAEARPARRRLPLRRLVSASALGALGVAVFTISAITAPTRAIGAVSDAMKRVHHFHVRMELPNLPMRYEAWGVRDRAARVEEWEGDRLSMIVIDNGKRLRSFDPDDGKILVSETQLKTLMRQTMGFSATRMLRRAAQGDLFGGQEWLGEAQAREVAQIRRNGVPQRRIEVGLKEGFFERMVVYADLKTDRLTQANLYMDAASPDEQPSARVFFEYPEKVNPMLFRLPAARSTVTRKQAPELRFP